VSDARYLGLDLGGTHLRIAAVGADGALASPLLSVPTGPGFGPDELERVVPSLVDRVAPEANGAGPTALGFATVGVVGPGPLTQCGNLPRLDGVDVEALLRAVVRVPLAIENDARCFTLAEARFGAARGARHVVGLTLGTGLGAGVMVDGRLHRGAASEAGEIYRIPLRGEPIERFLSGGGIVRTYAQVGAGATAAGEVNAERIAERARSGDATALAAWRSFGEDLLLLGEIVSALLDPEVVVVGGSLTRAHDLFGSPIEARFAGGRTRIAWSTLGPAAGVIGAAALHMA
jgi:glucokinase